MFVASKKGLWPSWSLAIIFGLCTLLQLAAANPDAKRLYDDLLSNYNKDIRPVGNSTDRLTVKIGLKLSQIIGVDIKRQIIITNVWIEQEWLDYKLKWKPEEYGNVRHLHVPSQHIWLPDIVLYNNADGNYEVTIMTKAVLHHSGKVVWNPPAIYKSSCEIDVEFFPFDEQNCFMKFGSWTYDGYMVDLRHINQRGGNNTIDMGMDLQEYYISTEWDVMNVPAIRNEKYYPCCEEPYPDIIFYLALRRKSLFYTVNVIIPCVGISFLSVLVFHLPSDSGEKVSLSISILLSLTVFFLLLAEIIPSTSMSVPLLGKYLLFTMILVSFSVVMTIGVLNVNFRTPATHKMAPWVKSIFVEVLPKFLFIERPAQTEEPGPFDPLPMPSDRLSQHGEPDDDVEEEVIENCSQHSSMHKQPCPVTIAASVNSMQVYGDNGIMLTHNHLRPPSQIHQLDGLATLSPLEYSHRYHQQGQQNLQQPYGAPPPLPPHQHHQHGQYHPSHAHAHTHPPLHDENGVITNDPNDESATSDLATSYLAYSDYEARLSKDDKVERELMNPAIERATNALKFVAQHVKNEDNFNSYADDWKYVAMVLDRILLWMFTIACVVGTGCIIMAAPTHYDFSRPIDVQYSKIDKKSDLQIMMKNAGMIDE